MSAILSNEEILRAPETLHVLVVYDDRASRDHVLRIRDHLIEHFGEELEVVCSWWKFEFLGDPNFSSAAEKEVDRADVMLFAVHSRSTLPASVQSWLEKAVARRPQGRGLLALLSSGDPDSDLGLLDNYLSELALHSGMDYLGASSLGSLPSELARKSITHRAFTRTSVMDDILNYRGVGHARWGINE